MLLYKPNPKIYINIGADIIALIVERTPRAKVCCMNIDELWDIALYFFYDNRKAFVDELSSLWRKNKVKTIIDCSYTVGFPCIDLKKKGFDMHCAGFHTGMIKRLKKNSKKQKVAIPFTKSKWQELALKLNKQFDCVMCRGNSFIYINSLGKKSLKTDGIRKDMVLALKNFYNLTKEGGYFYIDLPEEAEYSNGNIFFNRFDKKRINGEDLSLIWDVKHLSKKKIRKVDAQIFHWDENKIISRDKETLYAPMLYPKELLELMREVGFKNIKPLKLKSEANYTAFIAQR